MKQLSMSGRLNDRHGTFDAGLKARLKELEDGERRARTMAAKAATSATRANFSYKRDSIAPRPGRSSTGGRMKQHLSWIDVDGKVRFDLATADREVEHWIIQEIGTGKRATMRKADEPNPIGRPRKGATHVRTVKSQKGRRISGGLVFATGGQYSPPGSRRDEQLQWASRVMGVPMHSRTNPRGQAAGIRIRNEIQGQHFVKKGGIKGFREYKQGVLAAARQAFQKSGRP